MELKGITELDLHGLLFVHFPDDVPLDECRDRLELLAYEAWEDECSGLEADECPQLCMSPYWIFRALSLKCRTETRRLTINQRKEQISDIWKTRKSRISKASQSLDKP